jgi:hypothetical protein
VPIRQRKICAPPGTPPPLAGGANWPPKMKGAFGR